MGRRIILPTQTWLNDVKGKRKVVRSAKREKGRKKVRLLVNKWSSFTSLSFSAQYAKGIWRRVNICPNICDPTSRKHLWSVTIRAAKRWDTILNMTSTQLILIINISDYNVRAFNASTCDQISHVQWEKAIRFIKFCIVKV